MHRIGVLCVDGLVAFDLAAPAQVFALAAGPDGAPLYEVLTCGVGGAEVMTTSGFQLRPQHGLRQLAGADTVVVPGYLSVFEPPPRQVMTALRAASRSGARILSVCTGAFALAHAGLLDGRRATTHWAFADALAASFPAVAVDPTSLYVDEGAVMTSAGLSAAIDLSLHVIREDFGTAVGERVARHMVAAPHRDGGQAQFIKGDAAAPDGSLERTRRWAVDRLGEPLDVPAMAKNAGVSPRTFARRFREESGRTPLQWLLAQRVLAARHLLEETDLPIEEVASRAGFGTASSLREHFRRGTRTTPTAYRRAFRSSRR